ncbi:MAG: hypothetical protein U9R15_12010 [Chloroflexota bacterium]|nr:hypothetical protein [Chloroflexota bacterium]
MRVAITTDSFRDGLGGVATAVAALTRALRAAGHTVRISLPPPIPPTPRWDWMWAGSRRYTTSGCPVAGSSSRRSVWRESWPPSGPT